MIHLDTNIYWYELLSQFEWKFDTWWYGAMFPIRGGFVYTAYIRPVCVEFIVPYGFCICIDFFFNNSKVIYYYYLHILLQYGCLQRQPNYICFVIVIIVTFSHGYCIYRHIFIYVFKSHFAHFIHILKTFIETHGNILSFQYWFVS